MAALKTRAVLICDDDLLLRLNDVQHAFRVWQANKDRIVGIYPRHYYTGNGELKYNMDPLKDYSMILTKMMIIGSEYLTAYTCLLPGEMHAYIDANMNCEDIAMNFLISGLQGKPPIHVDHRTIDYGVWQVDGISLKNEDWREARNMCLNEFARIMKRNPLVSSSSTLYEYRGNSLKQTTHHPSLVYKRPSP